MTHQLRTIHLHGALKDFSPTPFKLAVHDVRDVISALKSRFKGFRKFLNDHPEMAFIISDQGKKNPRVIEAEFINAPFAACEEIHMFTPPTGAGAEIIASFATWIESYGVSEAVATMIAFVVVNVAIAIAVSAVTQMLAPQTTNNGGSSAAAQPSFLYNGPQNVIDQGYQVPIVYGIAMTGSVVVASGIRVEQIPPDVTTTTTTTSPPAVPWQFTGDGGGDGTAAGSPPGSPGDGTGSGAGSGTGGDSGGTATA